MAGLSVAEREGLVNLLAINCDCTSGQRQALNHMSDAKLVGLRNALRKFVGNEFAEGSNASATGSGTKQAGGSGEKGEYQHAGVDISKVRNEDEGEEDEGKNKHTENQEIESYFERTNAPAALRAVYRGAVENMNRDKARLVGRLTANVRHDERRRMLQDSLMRKPLDELHLMAEMVQPTRNAAPQVSQELANYLGAGGGPVDNVGGGYMTAEEEGDVLPMPTINWNEVVDERRQGRSKVGG